MSLTLLTGDCRALLPTLPERSVQCVITSPPYFNLRDYGTATWAGGDAGCDHLGQPLVSTKSTLRLDGREHLGPYDGEKTRTNGTPYRSTCGKCGAQRIDAQIGLEPLHDCLSWARDQWYCEPRCYVCTLREVFAAVWRVLRDDGCVFLNLGDSYASSSAGGDTRSGFNARYFDAPDWKDGKQAKHGQNRAGVKRSMPHGLKSKDLIGIPWRVALALQADGWYLRSDVIWAKLCTRGRP